MPNGVTSHSQNGISKAPFTHITLSGLESLESGLTSSACKRTKWITLVYALNPD